MDWHDLLVQGFLLGLGGHMKRGCIGCDNVVLGADHLTICDYESHKDRAPKWCPLLHPADVRQGPTWLVVAILCVTLGVGGFSLGRTTEQAAVAPVETPEQTAVQLASQVTVLYPSYLTYSQQKRLLQKTLLSRVDFIYIERRIYEETGVYVDALTVMAICAHESGWGSKHWATEHNNPMSWGVSDSNPDQTVYPSATYGVYIAVRGLVSLYYKPGATYYSLTLWDMNKYYCPGSAESLAWANGVDAIVKELEAKLTPEQLMRRWANKTGLLDAPTDWSNDATHRLGWALWKVQNSPVVAGR